MQYGFVLDQDKCIGCHACTTACKAENGVPLGAFRTWVKYTERGAYPQVKRHFVVLRCNHCSEPPCVRICPVNALTKRVDGIVDVDREACIGCRACMQACPYDAIYLNEDIGAVEKCHFCAHRVEQGLQPACVTVCPVGAIIPGDLDDPSSEVALIRKSHVLSARRVEQGTGPNVLYKGADEAALVPGSMGKPSSFLWSERPSFRPEPWPNSLPVERDAREVLNAEHKVEWGWQVAAYLVTKGVAAGTAMLAPFLPVLGLPAQAPWWYPEAIALVFTLLTVFLLIEDLKKPLHFYKLFTRPNWNSWLVKGGVALTAFGALSAAILLAGLVGQIGFGANQEPTDSAWLQPLRWLNMALGAMAAGYTAFLFAQCKGRDLWESRWLLPHLLVQAVMCGGAAYSVLSEPSVRLSSLLLGCFALHLACVWHELWRKDTDNARQAAGYLRSLRVLGVPAVALSVVVMMVGFPFWFGAPLFLLAGLYMYEQALVRAGQLAPLS